MNFWIFPTTAEHWELVRTYNVYAFQREADRDKIKLGDKTICYIVRSDPPVFVNILERFAREFWAADSGKRLPTHLRGAGQAVYPLPGETSPQARCRRSPKFQRGAEPFLVTAEKFEDEARSLLGGTFHEIKPHIRIIHWEDIVGLYKLVREVSEFEKKLRL